MTVQQAFLPTPTFSLKLPVPAVPGVLAFGAAPMCRCNQRRDLLRQTIQSVRTGQMAQAQQNIQRVQQTIRADIRDLGRAIRPALARTVSSPYGRR